VARPSRLDNPFVFRSVVRDQLVAKIHQISETTTVLSKKLKNRLWGTKKVRIFAA
jgi:hypothetical protein